VSDRADPVGVLANPGEQVLDIVVGVFTIAVLFVIGQNPLSFE